MRFSGATPANPLRSVSMRYVHPLAARTAPSRRLARHPGISTPLGGNPSGSFPENGLASRDEQIVHLEAVLFMTTEPITSRRLAHLAGLADGTKARTLVRTLNRFYDRQGRAFRVEEVAGGYQLLTRPKFAPWLRRLQAAQSEVRLSAPAMETLAVVAYRQPVLRAEIESIRGVQCDEVLRQLIERGLIRIAGRSDELGRPLLYGTTRQFLQVFGLRHLDALPRAEDFREARLSGGKAGADNGSLTQVDSFHEAGEEKNVKTTATLEFLTDDPNATAVLLDEQNAREEEFEDFDEEGDEDEDLGEDEDEDFDEDEDEDFDDEDDTWEEVEDDEEEEEDEDWDDEEDWEDEDEWDDDEEEWDDDDSDEEEEEEEE